MFGLGLPELLLILVIALVFVGPGKLPSVGAAIGKAVREFKAAQSAPDNPEETGASKDTTGDGR